MDNNYIPLLVYVIVVVVFALVFLLLAIKVGPKRKSPQKGSPYECGVAPIDNESKKFYVRFYIIGAFFILFDVETVFIIPWAIIYKGSSIFVLMEMLLFVLILLVGLIYIIRRGEFKFFERVRL